MNALARLPILTPLVLALSASLASAQVQSADQRRCITTLNGDLLKVARAQATDVSSCIAGESAGALSGSVEACLTSDPRGRVLKAQDRTALHEGRVCGMPPDFGATDAETVGQSGVDQELDLAHDVFGASLDGAILERSADPNGSSCQRVVTKRLQACTRTTLQVFNTCKKDGLKSADIVDHASLAACVGADPKGRVARACSPTSGVVAAQVDRRCVARGVDLSDAFPGCGTDDPAALKSCLAAAASCRSCLAVNAADGIAADCDALDDGLVNDSCVAAVAAASARVIADASDLIGGPLARGVVGDYLIENGEIRVIVQAPQRNLFGVGGFGGNPIDADIVRAPGAAGRDHIEEWSFMLNIENTANYTSVTILNDGSDGNAAIVRAEGVDDLLDLINPSSTVANFGFPFPPDLDDTDQPVTFTTDYILEPGENALRMETTVTNIGGVALDFFLGDFLSPLAQEPFNAGYGIGEPFVTTNACDPSIPCDFVAYAGEGETGGVSYGYIHTTPGTTSFNTDGVGVVLLGADAIGALIGTTAPNVTIGAGASHTVTRYLAVGDGDVASIIDARNRLKGVPSGLVHGEVTRGGAPVADAEVVALADPALGPGDGSFFAPFTTTNVVGHFRTDAAGRYSGTLPAGSYDMRVNLDGHLFGLPDPAAVVVVDGGDHVQDFTLPVPATLRVTVEDSSGSPIAGKVSVVGFDPSPDPGNSQSILGLISNNTGVFGRGKSPLPYGLATVVWVDHSGDSGDVPLEPGDYQVVVSHGPEYSTHVENITATSGGTVSIAAVVAEVIDTSGFVSGDFHVHSIDSVDCPITRRARIVSMLAEGVDFFTPSDHEFRADFRPDILEMGVSGLISTAVNNEITTFDYGHFGGFPMTIDPLQANGGALDWGRAAPPGEDFPLPYLNYGLSPGEIFAEIDADPGVNSKHVQHVGSFFDGGLHFDTGVAPPISTGDPVALRLDPTVANYWSDGFTALELWIQTSRNQDSGFLNENAGNWFNLLNQGIVRTGFGDSDTHHLVAFQSGSPRTYLASPTDDPGALWPLASTLAGVLNEGRVTSTNAPFLRVSAEGDPGETGGIGFTESTVVRAVGGAATLTVDVQSPTWAAFDTVEFYLNSETVPNVRPPPLPPTYGICPDAVRTAPGDFSVTSVPVNGSSRLEASVTLSLAGLTQDTWVVAMVKGSEDVSCPLFPVVPNDLNEANNPTLGDLTTCALGDEGVTSLAFSNPIFFDVDGNGAYDPPGLSFQASCP